MSEFLDEDPYCEDVYELLVERLVPDDADPDLKGSLEALGELYVDALDRARLSVPPLEPGAKAWVDDVLHKML